MRSCCRRTVAMLATGGDGGEPTIELVAAAGDDQSVSVGENCEAVIDLDASASIVPEGAVVTYTWTGPFPEMDPQGDDGADAGDAADGGDAGAGDGGGGAGDAVGDGDGGGSISGEQVMVTLPIGEHEITLTAESDSGETSTDTVIVTVVDGTPPEVSVVASPNVLWPPNHKMHSIDLQMSVSDDCDGENDIDCHAASVESNEAVNGRGDGNTSPDWRVNGDMGVRLRAERSGRGDGRVYTIHVECADSAGNGSATTTTVEVPHDRRNSKPPTDTPDDGGDDGDGDETPSTDRTKLAFKVNYNRPERNRFVGKLDISGVVDQLPEDLEGWELVVELGIEAASGAFDEHGCVKVEGLRAKVTRSNFLVVDLRGLDLADILFLDPDDDMSKEEILVSITALAFPPSENGNGDAAPITLFDDILESTYSQKAGRRGRGKRSP